MSYIDAHSIPHSTILRLYSEKDEIQIDPDYQRMGGVWTKEKKQLLIDSILNNYDIPKLYFHIFSREERNTSGFKYSIIDGRQRLEAIWQFMKGNFNLSDDFSYQDAPDIKLSGLSYEDIGKEFPKIKIKFDSFVLPVIGVQTDDLDLIEDMFSRLNEAVPLNAAEKRNAIGGDMVECIRELGNHTFFTNKVSFTNKRYQHREIVARFILLESSLKKSGKLIDTKKVYLDSMARNFKKDRKEEVMSLYSEVVSVLDNLSSIFSEKDPLLKTQGSMVVYYLTVKAAIVGEQVSLITRRKIIDFIENVKSNRKKAEENYEDASYTLLEYDRLNQQGTNDASNIKERVNILCNAIGISKEHYQKIIG
jgi:hypothetical protein